MGHFFSSSHLLRFFLLCHQKIFVPYIVLVTARLSLSFKIHCLQVFQLFQTKDGPIFFHRHSWLHLSRFFCCIIRKYISHILFWSQFVSVCFALKLFFSFKIHCLQMLQLFQTKDGPIFFIVTLVYTCHAFFALSSKNICPIYCFGHSSSQSVSQWNSFFSFKIHCLQIFQLFQTKDGPIFFIVTLVYTCRTFFCSIIRKYLSHVKFWSQLITAMKLFFSFKIHCLQMLHLFQSRDGPIFFIVTLVYTCCTFFAASAETVCPIYSLMHSSFQSVAQWNSFSPLKYIVYKCYYCFSQRMGHFFRLLQRWT